MRVSIRFCQSITRSSAVEHLVVHPARAEFATTSGGGWLTNFNGNATLTSANFVVPANTPFTVSFTLNVASIAGMNQDNSGLAESSANFGSTMSFVTNQPVFSLPSGYTANSVSGGIVANQYVLTPEPTSAMLAAIALVMAAAHRRHWRTHAL